MDRQAEPLCDRLPKAVWHQGTIAEIALHAVRESVGIEEIPIISHDLQRIEHATRILNFYATRAQELEELAASLRKRNLESRKHLEKFKRRNAELEELLQEREQLIQAGLSSEAGADPGSGEERRKVKRRKSERPIVLPAGGKRARKRADKQKASSHAIKGARPAARQRKTGGSAPAIRAGQNPLAVPGEALLGDAAEGSGCLIGCRLPA
jgi:hypothetical protein